MNKYLLAILSGLIFARSFPSPYLNMGYLAWIAFVPLLLAVKGCNWKKSLLLMFIMILSACAFVTDGIWFSIREYYQVPLLKSLLMYLTLVVIGASGGWLTFILLHQRFAQEKIESLFFMPLVWLSVEFLFAQVSTHSRAIWIGYSQHHIQFLYPIAKTFGTLGLGYFVILFNYCIFALLTWKKKPVVVLFGLICFIIASLFIPQPKDTYNQKSVRVALIQTNLPHQLTIDASYYQKQIDRMIQMSKEALERKAEIIIWPSTSIILDYPNLLQQTLRLLSTVPKEVSFIIGAMLYENVDNKRNKYNTVIHANHKGQFLNVYQKIIRTPFTEYIPFGSTDFLGKSISFPEVIAPSKSGARIFHINDLKIGTPICLEIFFPEIISRFYKNGANCLVHLSNDSVYGETNFLYHYFIIAKMRAIEFGLPLIRETVTGITAIIGPSGKIYKILPHHLKGTLFYDFNLAASPTLYANYGRNVEHSCVIFCLLILLLKLLIPQKKG